MGSPRPLARPPSPVGNARNSATQIALIILLTRVTRIFQKSVFTKSTPAARAGDRAGFFCCAHASRGRARRIFVRQRKGISHAVSQGRKQNSPRPPARATQPANAPACEDGDAKWWLQK